MNKFEFRSIGINDIPAMTDLLIGRQNIESKVFPFLKNKCLNERFIKNSFEKIFKNRRIIGIGAFRNNEMAGYLMGGIVTDKSTGRYVIVPYEGIAIGTEQSPELIKYLYAEISVLWLEQGCFDHSVLLPIGNEIYYKAFLQLSFAIEQVHAVMDIKDYRDFEKVADIDIRTANKGDREALGRMSSIIARYHNSAPVFIPIFPETLEKRREGFKELSEEDDIVLIAEEYGKEMGFLNYEIINPGLMVPDGGIELCVAGVYPSHMGRGIGKKLMNEGCRIIKDKEYCYIIADWRIANLASSGFWPKCGFKPVAYRMARYIDINYAWANFSNPSIKS